MTIEIRKGSVGPEGEMFMYLDVCIQAEENGPSIEDALAAVDSKVKELGTVQVAQTRDYIHNNGFRAITLIVNPESIKLGIEAMEEQFNRK